MLRFIFPVGMFKRGYLVQMKLFPRKVVLAVYYKYIYILHKYDNLVWIILRFSPY